MKQKINSKIKLHLLLIGFIIALMVVYSLAISNTFAIKHECAELENKIESLKSAPLEIKEIEKKLSLLNTLIDKKNEEADCYHNILLDFLSDQCADGNLIIKEFPKPHLFNTKDYTIETNKMSLEGEYNNLLKLINNIENSGMKGHIVSLKFSTQPEHRSGIYKLNLTIYEQNIYDMQ